MSNDLVVRENLIAKIDLRDPASIITFGENEQARAAGSAQKLLAATKNMDAGAAGDLISDMLLKLKGFNPAEQNTGFFSKLFGGVQREIAQKLQRFETVKSQAEEIEKLMVNEKASLTHDLTILQEIQREALDEFHHLNACIEAGKIAEERAQAEVANLTELAQQPDADPMASMNAFRMQKNLELLQRRVTNMELARQVVMQIIPAFQLVQENDQSLIIDLQDILCNALPLWMTQMSLVIMTHRMDKGAEISKAGKDLGNALLERNAELLRAGNAKVQETIHRNMFDITSVVKAKDSLIATLEDTRKIAAKAAKSREEIKAKMAECEDSLKKALQPAAEN